MTKWIQFWDLIYLLTRKEIALKYKRTVFGIFWSLLNPLLLACVYFVAFKIFMRFHIENYTFFLLSALFPWTWFSASVLIGSRSLIDNVSLIKKIVFPRELLIASVIFAQLINLLFSIPIIGVLAYLQGSHISWLWVPCIFLYILIQFCLTFGITLLVAMLNTYFRDVEYLVGVMINLLFWMTPIIYPMDNIPVKFQKYFLLNPFTSVINLWRELFMNNQIIWRDVAVSSLMGALFLGLGFLIFRKMERRLDEVL